MELAFDGVDLVHKLYRWPGLRVDALFCSPQETFHDTDEKYEVFCFDLHVSHIVIVSINSLIT